MILDTTSKSLEVLLGGAVASAQPIFYAAYADHTPSTFTPGAGDGLTNGATAVTAVAAPAGGIQRQIKLFSVFNNDTAAVIATVRINNNGTFRTLVKITLAIGDTLEYDPANGWKVITASGTIRSGISSFADLTGSLQAGQHGSLADGDHTGVLSGNARVAVRKNSAGSVFTRRRINLIEGTKITLTAADDAGNEEVDVTIDAAEAHFHWSSSSGATQLPADNTTRYIAPSGVNAPDATEQDHDHIMVFPCTVVSSRGRLNDAAPGGTATRTATLRKNHVDTGLTIAWGSADVNQVSTGGPVSYAAGDILTWSLAGANTPAASRVAIATRIKE